MRDIQTAQRTAGSVVRFAAAILVAVIAFGVVGASSRVNPKSPRTNIELTGGQNPQPSPCGADVDQLRKTIQQLNGDLLRLKKRIAELEKERQADSLQEKLVKEQQRAEALTAQLLASMEKESSLQSRIEPIDDELRPENLNNLPVGGSLHPEEVRETTRRRLTSEKRRLQAQLDLVRQDRTRLQSSLAECEASIQRLRLKIAEATH